MPSGRPSLFTSEIADEICRRLADGESLRKICRDENMPHERRVREWDKDNRNGFSPQYTRAREIGYETLADELLEIADDGRNDTYKDDDGNTIVNTEIVSRSRIRIDTRKWMLSKMLPKIYGDKSSVDMNVNTNLAERLEEARKRVDDDC